MSIRRQNHTYLTLNNSTQNKEAPKMEKTITFFGRETQFGRSTQIPYVWQQTVNILRTFSHDVLQCLLSVTGNQCEFYP